MSRPDGGRARALEPGPDRVRLDVWLWRARFFRTRALAAEAVARGLRVNGRRVEKPGAALRTGDVLTFAQGGRIRVIEVADLGARRGPATEAHGLYVDRDPPAAPAVGPDAARATPPGRDPTAS